LGDADAGMYSEFSRKLMQSWPLILRAFGRSVQELPVECQVEPLFINFSSSTAKKGCRQGQDLEISGNPFSKQRLHSDSTGTQIMGKPHRKN
jgi:hypothetical protein